MLRVALLVIFCGTVAAENDQLTVLVNRVKLYKGNDNSNIEYRYFDGDAVDVTCFHTAGEFDQVLISYHYVDKRLVNLGSTADMSLLTSPFYSEHKVGVRLTLQAAHNNSRVSCKCFNGGPEVTANVTFLLEDSVDDLMNLKVNDLALRPQNRQYSEYVIYYMRKRPPSPENEPIILECDPSNDDIILESYQYECESQWQSPLVQRLSPSTTGARLITDYSKPIRYEARNKTMSTSFLQTVDFRFEPTVQHSKEGTLSLSLNGTHNNDMITIYSPSNEVAFGVEPSLVIYYNYVEGDSVMVNCSINYDYLSDGYLAFDGTVQRTTSITKFIKLTSADDNKNLTCIHFRDMSFGNPERFYTEDSMRIIASGIVFFRHISVVPTTIQAVKRHNATTSYLGSNDNHITYVCSLWEKDQQTTISQLKTEDLTTTTAPSATVTRTTNTPVTTTTIAPTTSSASTTTSATSTTTVTSSTPTAMSIDGAETTTNLVIIGYILGVAILSLAVASVWWSVRNKILHMVRLRTSAPEHTELNVKPRKNLMEPLSHSSSAAK